MPPLGVCRPALDCVNMYYISHMRNKILFTESQSFRQWWLWLLLLGASVPLFYGLVSQLLMDRPVGDHPISNAGLLALSAAIILVIILFYLLRLDTLVKEDGIYVRFFPFRPKYRYFAWDKMTDVYIRKYSPIWEYGGWGYRIGIFGKGKAMNVSGNTGLQLVFKDGSKLLIGTGKAEELKQVLRGLGELSK
jgi:hypothetical protein